MPKSALVRKTNFLFGLVVVIGVSLLGSILWLAINIYHHLFLAVKSFFSKASSLCDCLNFLSVAAEPANTIFLVLFSAILTVFLAWVVIKILKLSNSTKNFVRFCAQNHQPIFYHRLSEIEKALDLKTQTIKIINNSMPFVFCWGLFKPKIYISYGLVKGLSHQELRAVILHEEQHRRFYEPLRLFITKLLKGIFFFVPGFSALVNQYSIFSELLADEQATCGFQNKRSLVDALSKIMQWKEQRLISNNLALSFFGTVTEERINKLANDNYAPKFKFSTIKLSLSFLIIIIIIFTAYALIFPKQTVIAKNSPTSCEHISDSVRNCQNKAEHLCDLKSRPYICPKMVVDK